MTCGNAMSRVRSLILPSRAMGTHWLGLGGGGRGEGEGGGVLTPIHALRLYEQWRSANDPKAKLNTWWRWVQFPKGSQHNRYFYRRASVIDFEEDIRSYWQPDTRPLKDKYVLRARECVCLRGRLSTEAIRNRVWWKRLYFRDHLAWSTSGEHFSMFSTQDFDLTCMNAT